MTRKTHLDPTFKAILARLDAIDGSALPEEPVENNVDRLQRLYHRLMNGRERTLRPGMMAMWKPGLRNRRFPEYGEPAIVVEILEVPIFDHETESSSPYYREPLDILLGVLDRDGDFLIYHYDSRRFQPYEGEGTFPR